MDEDCIVLDDTEEECLISDIQMTTELKNEENKELSMSDMFVLDEVKDESDSVKDESDSVKEDIIMEEISSTDDKKQEDVPPENAEENTTSKDAEPSQNESSSNPEATDVKETKEASKSSHDPFAYLHQDGHFSSEKFKIELRGLPRYYGLGELKRLLNGTLRLNCNKVKSPRNSSHVFVCLRSEGKRDEALATLNGYIWKNSKLKAVPAKPAPDPLMQIRKRQAETQEKDSNGVSSASKPKKDYKEMLRQTTVPLSDIPYNTQLEKKLAVMKKFLGYLGKQMITKNPKAAGWVKQQEEKFDGLPCELKPIRPSPLIDGYRNKCELTIGLHPETQAPTVGFRLGSYASGEVGVYPADDLRHLPDVMKKLAKAFEKLVAASPLPPWQPDKRRGIWQTLAIRVTREGQLMVIVLANVETLGEEETTSLKQEIKQFFTDGEGKEFGVHSVYMQCLKQKVKGQKTCPPELIHGEPYITEELMGVKLRISPLAFFQINTPAAEELYMAVADLASPTPDTTLLDICCGTGSIGLCLAKDCGQVLGVEVVNAAVDDAKANASANGLSHCDFFAGAAESVLDSIIARATRPNIVAILDPPRTGVNTKVINTIRKNKQIKRLVYMACSPMSAMNNFRDLSRAASKTLEGWPFLPVCAIPVDLFPHTPHCELAILFERVDPETFPPPPPGSETVQVQEVEIRKRKRDSKPANTSAPEIDLTEDTKDTDQKQDQKVDDSKKTKQQKSKEARDNNLRETKKRPTESKQSSRRRPRQQYVRASSSSDHKNTELVKKLRGFGRGMGPMRASYKQKQPGAQQSHDRDFSRTSQKPVIPQLQHRSSTRAGGRARRNRGLGGFSQKDEQWFDEFPSHNIVQQNNPSWSPLANRQGLLNTGAQNLLLNIGTSMLNEQLIRREQEVALMKLGNNLPVTGRNMLPESDANFNLRETSSQPSYEYRDRARRETLMPGEEMIPASMVTRLLEECRRDTQERALQQARMFSEEKSRRSSLFENMDYEKSSAYYERPEEDMDRPWKSEFQRGPRPLLRHSNKNVADDSQFLESSKISRFQSDDPRHSEAQFVMSQSHDRKHLSQDFRDPEPEPWGSRQQLAPGHRSQSLGSRQEALRATRNESYDDVSGRRNLQQDSEPRLQKSRYDYSWKPEPYGNESHQEDYEMQEYGYEPVNTPNISASKPIKSILRKPKNEQPTKSMDVRPEIPSLFSVSNRKTPTSHFQPRTTHDTLATKPKSYEQMDITEGNAARISNWQQDKFDTGSSHKLLQSEQHNKLGNKLATHIPDWKEPLPATQMQEKKNKWYDNRDLQSFGVGITKRSQQLEPDEFYQQYSGYKNRSGLDTAQKERWSLTTPSRFNTSAGQDNESKWTPASEEDMYTQRREQQQSSGNKWSWQQQQQSNLYPRRH